MSDRDALFAAIVANPDEDTPRLAYADWLDEHRPDPRPSPSSGPSARAEYIRVQCRLAGLPFDDPDYPELLEREEDLAEWLKVHTPDEESEPDLPDELDWYGDFDHGDDREFVRGFPDRFYYSEYNDEPQDTVAAVVSGLKEAFARSTVRSLELGDAYGAEVAGVVAAPVAAGLRGLFLDDLDHDEDLAVRAIAESPHLAGLRRLMFDFALSEDALRRLAKARHLAPEALWLDFPSATGLKALSRARWFRNLRELRLWLDNRDSMRAVAELPPMPNLVSLALCGAPAPSVAALCKFVASQSFPRLAKLALVNVRLTPEQLPILARGEWPLRHLRLARVSLRKAGAAALAGAAFADTLRVLALPDCEVTGGGVQALAAAPKLANLRHLDLSQNPVGPGGLLALVRSKHLRGLRLLSLANCGFSKAALDAPAMYHFLSGLEAPELRHLHLDNLPVGVRGGRALGGGAFANLTRLAVPGCGLRENGARAIVESDALPNLTALQLAGNTAGKALSKLADPKTFPRLASANLMNNRVPKGVLARLRKRPGLRA